MTTIMVPQF